jgi:hypothetical protein
MERQMYLPGPVPERGLAQRTLSETSDLLAYRGDNRRAYGRTPRSSAWQSQLRLQVLMAQGRSFTVTSFVNLGYVQEATEYLHFLREADATGGSGLRLPMPSRVQCRPSINYPT